MNMNDERRKRMGQMAVMKIVSDGSPEGTKVFGEDGHEITQISKIEITIEPQEMVTARLTFQMVKLEIAGLAVTK